MIWPFKFLKIIRNISHKDPLHEEILHEIERLDATM